MDKEYLKLEAERLAKDPIFLEVLKRIRSAAVERLINTSVDDKSNVITLQCMAKVCDIFPAELEAMVKSGQEQKTRTVV